MSDNSETFVRTMLIDDVVSGLVRVLSAIQEWEAIAWAKFQEWKNEMNAKYPNGFELGYDPVEDEAFTINYTEQSLYGSFAVSIAAMVEDQLSKLFPSGSTILIDGYNGKAANRPQFNDFMFTLEQGWNCSRKDIKYFSDHRYVRELSNRFKHSGGTATREFVREFSARARVEREGDQIPYNEFNWMTHLDQSKEFLVDCARRLYGNDCNVK